MANVYLTKQIDSEGLQKAYDALGVKLPGKVAVKISTGEPGGHNFLQPTLIAPLVQALDGTIVECNTGYPGKRSTSAAHWETIRAHGFSNIAPCDILDEEGELSLPVHGGRYLKENYVGDHIKRYDSMLMLSHFKGHMMGGFGGALKNMSIGLASSRGKLWIHSAGTAFDMTKAFSTEQNSFLASMAEADSAVMEYMGRENILYVNVANRLSVDCDCDSNPKEPEMADIGILASTDPVALDQACVDLVYASPDSGKAALIERMESRNGIHTVETAEKMGLGSRNYTLVGLD